MPRKPTTVLLLLALLLWAGREPLTASWPPDEDPDCGASSEVLPLAFRHREQLLRHTTLGPTLPDSLSLPQTPSSCSLPHRHPGAGPGTTEPDLLALLMSLQC